MAQAQLSPYAFRWQQEAGTQGAFWIRAGCDTGRQRAPRDCRSKVTIIDNDEPVREFVTRLLDREGFEIFTVSNPQEGLRLGRDRMLQ